ncbi:hypothetical protein [Streptomyces sp. NBC_00829]|uniref:hypothetical protein n=1 Tax=Streptomyces sp. NBC_00829 TaxID=2903679 RepID=UPI0038704771|nr:hypothetical protein OG293_22330 [Streptomyces sp. NBC_00829]
MGASGTNRSGGAGNVGTCSPFIASALVEYDPARFLMFWMASCRAFSLAVAASAIASGETFPFSSGGGWNWVIVDRALAPIGPESGSL